MLSGPTVSVEPSRNTMWARSLARVVTTSSAVMSLPICSTRSAADGGLPRGSPSTTDVTPTRDHAGPLVARIQSATTRRHPTGDLGSPFSIGIAPPPALPVGRAVREPMVLVDAFTLRNIQCLLRAARQGFLASRRKETARAFVSGDARRESRTAARYDRAASSEPRRK